MAAYKVLIKPSAAREIEPVDRKSDRRRIVGRILAPADDPRPADGEKLAGRDGYYRLRQGDFRVVYSIDDHNLEWVVVKVGHRRDIYR